MGRRIHIATRKGLFTVESRGSGARWAVTKGDFIGDNLSMVLSDARDGTLYAALDHGHFGVKMHRAKAGGAWEECAVPVYPEKPEGEVDNDFWGRPIPWSTLRIWALEAGGAGQPGHLWCGTLPGGLFYSQDGGDSWVMVRSLWDHPKRRSWLGGGADWPGIHSICVNPQNPRNVFIAISSGGVWATEDMGESWQPRSQGMWAAYMPPERKYEAEIQDAHRLVQCPARPEKMWVQHHNGIFRSIDAGESWSEVRPETAPSFGFAVAVHPTEPDTAWFVPGVSDQHRIAPSGEVVVTRTRDGGQSFEVLRKGLPQGHAYDIAFRHALDIDETGNRLAFGTTTGNLWVSEDQGDSWQCVSTNLPPVHAVRFDPAQA